MNELTDLTLPPLPLPTGRQVQGEEENEGGNL